MERRTETILAAALAALLAACPATDDDDASGAPDEPSAPSAPEVVIGPEAATTVDDLVAEITVESVDPDGDFAAYAWSWTVDGDPVPELDGAPAVEASRTAKGQAWAVSVAASDATGLTSEAATASITVANAAPGAPVIHIAPAAPIGGEDPMACLVDVDATDPDGDPVTHAVAWTVDGEAYPRAGDSGPLTAFLDGDTVPQGDTAPGQLWTCAVTPTDAEALVGDPAVAEVTTSEPPPPEAQPDFLLADVNETSPTFGTDVSPRDYLEKVSGWYFGHAT